MHCKPFDVYINENKEWIKRRRAAFPMSLNIDPALIIDANSPFELKPAFLPNKNEKYRYGALFIHGLLDSPFSLRDLAARFQQAGILSRAILLPGHGTHPTDLLTATYKDWLDTLRYGIESLREQADQIILVGYSTGATLSIHHALNHGDIHRLVLLAPALKILPPTSTLVRWPILANFFSQKNHWLCQEIETDYTKYESVPLHPVLELGKLINTIQPGIQLDCPMLTVMSQYDETVSSATALKFFASQQNDKNKFLLYTKKNPQPADYRIEARSISCPDLRINHLSHISLPFSPENSHYGARGDQYGYDYQTTNSVVYGAYNRVEIMLYDKLYQFKLLKNRRMTLSYNPDFDYMANAILEWVL